MNVTGKGLLYKQTLLVNGEVYTYYDIQRAGTQNKVTSLPFSIKMLLEATIRHFDGKHMKRKHIDQLVNWERTQWEKKEIPFKPARIVFQDFTGVPAIVELAAMRNAVNRKGGDVSHINPQIPVDLVIDHSVIVDHFGHKGSFNKNVKTEYERNLERYRFLRWAQKSFENLRVVPPSNGIVHQVNLEYLASAVMTKKTGEETEVYPDSLVGTDSHTPMINGLGTVGWGVGGIEAEAAMLGQPLYFVMPQVVGVKLTGKLQEGVTATDLALTITQLLRKKDVVGKFVEFFGSGLSQISLADRATIANMAPEYGATMGYFPPDKTTMDYLRLTGRGEVVPLAEAYFKAQGLYREDDTPAPSFTDVIELDLATVAVSVAGPKRPQDRTDLGSIKQSFELSLTGPLEKNGYGLKQDELNKKASVDEEETEIGMGSIVLASITSCTNTSNPNVMIAAGLLAKKAIEMGLQKSSFVKASLTPGSKVVTQYLESSGLLSYLEGLGFYVDGYGCAICCGNSGALVKSVEEAIRNHHLITASVLSGNRNFEGRVHPLIKANYLCSPPLVVAFAVAGTVKIDMTSEPIGFGHHHQPVYLKDIWPTTEEIQQVVNDTIHQELFIEQYSSIFENEMWASIEAPDGMLYEWDPHSTYIQKAPYFQMEKKKEKSEDLKNVKVLLFLGDSITTDHISPAGAIPLSSPAGKFLIEKGVSVKDFNAYGTRRGNHHVMVRGTFANIRINNKLTAGLEGGYTKYLPTGEIMSVYDAAMYYQESNQKLMVIAGKEYGTGSSRDWAAKGTALLGVKVVLAESFERIHRSNLVGMGVLPLQFMDGENAQTLRLSGTETFTVKNFDQSVGPGDKVDIEAIREDGFISTFKALVRIDSQIEMDYYHNGGILPTVLNRLMSQ